MSDRDLWLETGGVKIRYHHRALPDAKARVLILPGFTEFIEKHQETADNFAAMGLESLVLDWPGQGRSTRLTSTPPYLIHSTGFDLHLQCLDAVASTAGFVPESTKPLFVFGHSMGGHLAMRYAHEYSSHITAVMVTAPMILPPITPPLPVFMLARLFSVLGFARYPALFRKPERRNADFFEKNALTRDPQGYAVQPDWWDRDHRLLGYGASFGWVCAAYESCLATTANSTWMKAFQHPLSAHIAGDERIVHDPTTRRMLPLVPAAEVYDYPHARHELLLELPEVRALLWQRLGDFIAAKLT